MKLGLIGFPIGHSLSPWIHGRFLEKSDIAGEYESIQISPEDSFEEELERIKTEGINGFNVTVPYKTKIVPYLDGLDKNAAAIGAVNTVVYKDGQWIGYNTDGTGYVAALNSKFPSFSKDKSRKVLIIGAGGASRGIYYALVAEGFTRIDIANRTAESAHAIAAVDREGVQTDVLTLIEAENNLGEYDLVIQTTSVGMKPNVEGKVMSLQSIEEGCIASDIVYQPIQTAFLQEAQAKGAAIHYGHTMLLYQAQAAFELWTNKKVPIGNMDQQLKNILEGRS
ncbi:shikimate dehydrogenase [Virgibacillus kekensis]|uniref:Shikimate dehydrogenase (NADP(+)) n=1 Tax=Virgibacillus kekensis TaxID=202261 RepID=A0ABV9DJ55_9BACI